MTRVNNYLLHLYFAILSVVFWRKTSLRPTQILPGDAADARYTTSLYEHWHLFFNGKLGLTQNYFFAPTINTMSFSDAYLFQGIIHSIFRNFGLTIIASWLITTIFTHLIGAYSAILIAKQFNLNLFASGILVTFWGFNSVLWVQRGHVQNLAYPLLGYMVYFLIKFGTSATPSRKINYLAISIVCYLVLAMTTTYVFVFVTLIALIFFLLKLYAERRNLFSKVNLKFKKNTRKYWDISVNLIKSNLLRILIWSCLIGSLLFVFLYTYIFSVDKITTRSPAEAAYYSPSFFELVEVPPSNLYFGELASKIASGTIPPIGERYMGYTLIFLVLFAFSIRISYKNFPKNKSLFLLGASLIVIELLILKDARGLNIWYFTFGRIPLFEAIRGLSRYHQFAYMMGGLFIGLVLNNYKFKKRFNWVVNIKQWKYKYTVMAILIGIGSSEAAGYYGSWNSKEMNPIQISKEQLKPCKYFALTPVEESFTARPWYLWLIDAQIVATNFQIPVISGYSGGTPRDYSIDFTNSESNYKSSLEFAKKKNLKQFCLITNSKNEINKWKVVSIS